MSDFQSEYVPVDTWPGTNEMAIGLDENRLPLSDGLAGRQIALHRDDGTTVNLSFAADQLETDLEGAAGGPLPYEAIEMRPGVFLLDFAPDGEDGRRSLTIALHLGRGAALIASSELVETDSGKRVETTFTNAGIDGKSEDRIEPSTGLIGKHILWRYSDNNLYEHFYLNSGTYAWHCRQGQEQHLADVEQTRTWSVDDDLFLFFWTETVMPVDAVIFLDLEAMQSTGRFFGWDTKEHTTTHVTFGGRGALLADLDYSKVDL